MIDDNDKNDNGIFNICDFDSDDSNDSSVIKAD
jgi:hypothetical protein